MLHIAAINYKGFHFQVFVYIPEYHFGKFNSCKNAFIFYQQFGFSLCRCRNTSQGTVIAIAHIFPNGIRNNELQLFVNLFLTYHSV